MQNMPATFGSTPSVNPSRPAATVLLQRFFEFLPVVLIAAVVCASALRLFSPTTLWLDEAMLVANVRAISWADVLNPLPFYDQIAPLAYVTLLKVIYSLAGLSETMLRLPSWLALIGSLVLIARLPGLDRATRLVAAAMIVGSFTTVRIATDAKPYMFEVLFALALMSAFHPQAETYWRHTAVRLALLCMAAISTTAFPMVCFAVGAPAVLLALQSDVTKRLPFKQWQSLRYATIFTAALAVYVIYFTGYLAESLRLLTDNHAYAFAADGFNTGSGSHIFWLLNRFAAIIGSHWSTAPAIILMLLAAGILHFARVRSIYAAQFLILTGFIVFLNLTGHFPIMERRFSTFMMPWLAVITGAGVSLVAGLITAASFRPAIVLSAVIFTLSPAIDTLRDPFHQQARASLRHIASNPAIPLVSSIAAQPVIDVYLAPPPKDHHDCTVAEAGATTTRCTAGKAPGDGAFQNASTKWYLMNYVAVASWGGSDAGFPGPSIAAFSDTYYDWLVSELRRHPKAHFLLLQGRPSVLAAIHKRLRPEENLTRIIDERPPSPTLGNNAAQLFVYDRNTSATVR